MDRIEAIDKNIRYVTGMAGVIIDHANRHLYLQRYSEGKELILADGACPPKNAGALVCETCLVVAPDGLDTPMCERYKALQNGTIEVNE